MPSTGDGTAGAARAGSPSVDAVTADAPRDSQRSRVYRAEDAWGARLDAARRGARFATVGGSALLLPEERRFGDLAAARTYVRGVLAAPAVVAALGRLAVPELRECRGGRAAHWEPPGTIAVHVPRHGEPWALREAVLLHELAHHAGRLAGLTPHHAAPFPALVLLLVEASLGDQAAFALRVAYGEERVQVGAL